MIMIDKDLKRHVENALDWEPSVDAKDIGVAVDQGVVTLRGTVRSYAEKVTAERVALHVYGVTAIANDLLVHVMSTYQRTDTEIAQAAVSALKWHTVVPDEHVTVTIKDGWITLAGSLDWQFQKDAADRAVRDLTGVKGVTNDIRVQPHVKTTDVRAKIEAAFTRSAEIDARRVSVTAQDGKVTLAGNVRSWAERQEAERAAWAAPGVSQVDDRIIVVP
jgi:osmotically-inducible protein OsmY